MSDSVSCLARLRADTRQAHARIETVPALARLMAPDLTVGEYVSVLQHLHAFHATFEPAIGRALVAHPEAASMLDGARPASLAADLAWFGAPRLRSVPFLPLLDGPGPALGALYVIEGSGLGARVIARHLADSLGVGPGAGGSFYGGQSAEAARLRWRRVCALLDTSVDASVGASVGASVWADDGVVAGAVATFGCLDRLMRRIEIATDAAMGRLRVRAAPVAA